MRTSLGPYDGVGTSRTSMPGPATVFTRARMRAEEQSGNEEDGRGTRRKFRRDKLTAPWSEGQPSGALHDRSSQTTVDAEHGAGYVARRLGGEEGGHRREFIGLADAANRQRFTHHREHLPGRLPGHVPALFGQL